MNELRWILLLIGLAVIAVIWFVTVRRRKDGPPELTEEVEPGVDLDQLEEIGRALAGEVLGEGDYGPERVLLVLHVAAEEDLDGHALFAALEEAGLEFGEMGIFHAREDDEVVFSVANILEPGTFGTEATPGVSLFAQVPRPGPGLAVYARMLACARGLATVLDAEVLDHDRSPLTEDAISRVNSGIDDDGG